MAATAAPAARSSNTSPARTSAEVIDPHAPPKIVRSPEEIAKLCERLYDRDIAKIKKSRQELEQDLDFKIHHNEVKSKKIGAPLSEAEERSVKSCYTLAMERKAKGLETLSQKHSPSASSTTKTLAPEEVEQVADRLCGQSMKHKAHLLEETERKVYGAPQEVRVLDKDALQANIKSIYYEAMKKKKEADEKLSAKYLFNRRDPHPEKLTPQQIADLGQRLSTKGGK